MLRNPTKAHIVNSASKHNSINYFYEDDEEIEEKTVASLRLGSYVPSLRGGSVGFPSSAPPERVDSRSFRVMGEQSEMLT